MNLGFRRFLTVLPCVWVVSGCEQTRPPTAEGLRRIAARTATGTVNTKLEARVQPAQVRAGEFSFWDLKVFDIKDKKDGVRQEWKFFNDLPQTSTNATLSEVLMKAWIVSRDGQVFLPARPKYQAYGSFNTDWTLPRAGKYSLFVQYQPVRKGKIILPVELAKWDFSAAPGKTAPDPAQKPLRAGPRWAPTRNPAAITRGGAPDGEPAGALSILNLPTAPRDTKAVTLQGVPDGAEGVSLAALSASGSFFHFPRRDDGSFSVSFPQTGMMRIWAYFTLNGAPYAAPLNHLIS